MKVDQEESLNGYTLSRSWFDFAFENPDLVNTNHSAMFFWFIELNNRMGWATKFACPASQTMAAIGIKSYNTYIKTFNDLVSFGVVKLIKESKNQYTACVIALSNFDKAPDKALDKAMQKHVIKQVESTDSINKQLNHETNKQINTPPPVSKIKIREEVLLLPAEHEKLLEQYGKDKTDWMLDKLNSYKKANGKKYKSDYDAILTWVVVAMQKDFNQAKPAEQKIPMKERIARQNQKV